MNIPDPIMPPITTMVASKIPRRAVRPEGTSADSGLPEEVWRSWKLGGTGRERRTLHKGVQAASANLSSHEFNAKSSAPSHRLRLLLIGEHCEPSQLLLKAQNSNHMGLSFDWI
jgi:hypothetical protein